jgi:CRISPR-associated protein Cas1
MKTLLVALEIQTCMGDIAVENKYSIDSANLPPYRGGLVSAHVRQTWKSPPIVETSGYQTKQSLVYDLQEPFRWIADVAVMDAFESRVLDLPDFYFTGDDYRYRFQSEAKQRFLDLLRERFNSGVTYKARSFKWDTVIEREAVEFGRFLANRIGTLDFSEPSPTFSRNVDVGLRRRILCLSQSEAKGLGIGKSTLHYLRDRAKTSHSLQTYGRVRSRLESEHYEDIREASLARHT